MNKKDKKVITKKPAKKAPSMLESTVDPKAKSFLESVVDKIRMGI